MNFRTTCKLNTIYCIDSLPRNEQGAVRRVQEHIQDLTKEHNFRFFSKHVDYTGEFVDLMFSIFVSCLFNKEKPIIYLDFHGDPEGGLCVSGSNKSIPWSKVLSYFRYINEATGNNLCIVASVCYATSILRELTSTEEHAPFYAFLAPDKEITVGDIEDSVPKFFDHIFRSGNITSASKTCLRDKYHLLTCEQILLDALTFYLLNYCRGSKKQKRIEKLLTRCKQELSVSNEDLPTVRKAIKQTLSKLNQAILYKSKTFLGTRQIPFSYDDLINHVGRVQRETTS